MKNYDMQEYLSVWDTYCENAKTMNDLFALLSQKEFSFFFDFEGSVYAGPEESRVIFAKMKHPDATVNHQWKKDANFSGTKLEDMQSERIFSAKDLKKIRVIDQGKAMNTLLEKGKKENEDARG